MTLSHIPVGCKEQSTATGLYMLKCLGLKKGNS